MIESFLQLNATAYQIAHKESLPACFRLAKVRLPLTFLQASALQSKINQSKVDFSTLLFLHIQAHAAVPFDKNFIFLILNII